MSVIIVGGGIAGTTLALALSHLSAGTLDVHVIEAITPTTQAHPGYDTRALALAQGTVSQLTAIGLWPHLSTYATPITTIRVSDRGHFGHTTISAQAHALPALGYVVELFHVGKTLYPLLKQAPGVTLHCPASLSHVQREQASVIATLRDGQTIAGKLLVAADGKMSALATECGLHWQQVDYHQVAVICTVSTAQPQAGCAFERFTEHGPLALLPLSGNRYAVVWCHPQTAQQAVLAWSDNQFLQALQRAFGWRLGQFTHVGKRESYPLTLYQANRHIHHRLALVGNAAQALHPVAGQGFNLGLRDVMVLADSIVTAWHTGEDYGHYTVLDRYQARRQADQRKTIALTSGLVRLFTRDEWPIIICRNLGLTAMNLLPWLKRPLTTRTLGWRSD